MYNVTKREKHNLGQSPVTMILMGLKTQEKSHNFRTFFIKNMREKNCFKCESNLKMNFISFYRFKRTFLSNKSHENRVL